MQHLDDGQLQAWLDAGRAGLSAGERAEIERHLAACAPCAQRAREAEGLDGRARSLLSPLLADEAMPPFGEVVTRARRARAGEGGAGGHQVRIAAAWAATVALALAVGWWARELPRPGGAARTAATAPAPPPPAAPAPAPLPAAPAGKARAAPAAHPPVQLAEASRQRVGGAGATRSPAEPTGVPTSPAAAPPPEPAAEAERAAAPLALDAAQPRPPAAAPAPSPQEAKSFAASVAPGAVRGRVTDESGRPLAYAQVVLEGTHTGAFTKADGTFSLPLAALPATAAEHTVTVTAQLLGYAPASRLLVVGSGRDAFTELRLAPQAVALEAVTVVGASGAPGARGGAGAPVWIATTQAEAERRAGFRVLTVPELEVVRIELPAAGGGTRVRVTQRLPQGGWLQLVEAREALTEQDAVPAAGGHAISAERDGIHVLGTAPVDAGALVALLARLR